MKKCNQCGRILPDTSKFCRYCGSAVTDPSSYTEVNEHESEVRQEESEKSGNKIKKCKNCGSIVPDTAKFCNVCGLDMRDPANFSMVDEKTENHVKGFKVETKEKESVSDSSESASSLKSKSGQKEKIENTDAVETSIEGSGTDLEVPSDEKNSDETKKSNAENAEPDADVPLEETSDQTAQELSVNKEFDTQEDSNETPERPKGLPDKEEKIVHQVKKCNKCGNIVPENAKFCNICGSDMRDAANYTMVDEGSDRSAGTDEKSARQVKKCNRCGNIVANDAKFCNVCGTDMNNPANYTMVDAPKGGIDREQVRQAVNTAGTTVKSAADAVNRAVKSDKVQNYLHNKKAVLVTVIAVTAVIVGVIIHTIMPKTINLANYTTISVTGYDGHGVAKVTVNGEKLETDIINAAKKKHTSQYVYDFSPAYSLNKSKNLSNGDTVTLTWNVDRNALDQLKIRLKTDDVKKEVSDLKKADTFDAFKEIKVQVSGAAPYGEAKLNKVSTDGLVYHLNKSTGLSNGDKIKVTVSSSYDDDDDFTKYVQKYGKMPKRTSKTYEVSDLDTYITSAGDLSDDAINKMKSQAEDVIKADNANNLSDDVHLESLTYQGLYFLKAKDRKDDDDDDYYDDAFNKVYIVELQTFTATDWDADGETYTEKAYTAVEFNSISKASDGTINVDLSDYSDIDGGFYTDDDADVYLYGYETQEELYEDIVTAQADRYTSETKAAS